jgi:hypothetical protein
MPDRSWYQGFREEWGHDNDHQTGFNPQWVDTMPDLLSPAGIVLSNQYLAELQTMPLAPCEAAWGCSNAAGFYVNLHGCASLLICEHHLNEWAQIVLEALQHGGAFCDDCRLIYPSLFSFMIWRLV